MLAAEIGILALLASTALNVTYQHEIHPFYEGSFETEGAFVAWLNELGAQELIPTIPILNDPFDPTDDSRVFTRQLGGERLTAELRVEPWSLSSTAGVQSWVPAYDALGEEGDLVLHFLGTADRRRVLLGRFAYDGQARPLRWDLERVGPLSRPNLADQKSAAKKLARRGFLPLSLGFDGSDLYMVGIKEEIPGRKKRVKLRFKSTRLFWSKKKLEKQTNSQGAKGFRLAAVLLDGRDATYVFAREKIKGRHIEHRCETYKAKTNPQELLELLNDRGAEGFRFVGGWPINDGLSSALLLCDQLN